MPDRFGIAGLRHTEGPRRLADFGPHTSPELWATSHLLIGGFDDDCLLMALDVLYGNLGFTRDPGNLGLDDCKSEGKRLLLGLPYADTAEPDDRPMTIEDLVAFGKDD